MSTSPTQDAEHDMKAYLRVRDRLNSLSSESDGYPVVMKSILGLALNKLSSMPIIHFPLWYYRLVNQKISIFGEEAGTLGNPNVDLILQKSTPSPFGRGDQTVMDPTYRNGREIAGKDIELQYTTIQRGLLEELPVSLFVGREVRVKLYKLAIYEEGGHFDWHRDSTHSDQHHGTVLVALGTSWTGGDVLLRHNGVEHRVDLHPSVSTIYFDNDDKMIECEGGDPDDPIHLRAVAFYTDIEHKVEPVTRGMRMILQYDIEIVKKEGDVDPGDEEDPEEAPDSDDDPESKFYDLDKAWQTRKAFSKASQTTVNEPAISKVAAIIEKIHASGTHEVAFPLQHLYRKASIRPEYLKGSDAASFNALEQIFDVSLHPIILEETVNEDGNTRRVYRFDACSSENDAPEIEPSKRVSSKAKNQKKPSTVFYMTNVPAVEEVSNKEYLEHTGNESQSGELRYFAGGMFVRPKKNVST